MNKSMDMSKSMNMGKSITKFREILGGNLISVVKFGTEGQAENLLFVVDKLDYSTLEQIKVPVREHVKDCNIVPLFFTKEELTDGADVFPLEFLDIKQPHEILYGDDVLSAIKFDKRHVRRQLEFELRSKLIHLRENYIWIKNDKDLTVLLSSALPSIMPLCYGLLYIKDIEAPAKLDELFKIVKEEYKVEIGILKHIRELKEKKPGSEELQRYVKQLLEFLTELGEVVDNLLL